MNRLKYPGEKDPAEMDRIKNYSRFGRRPKPEKKNPRVM